jgi:hypothetical protein
MTRGRRRGRIGFRAEIRTAALGPAPRGGVSRLKTMFSDR